jgi:transposase
MGTRIGRGRIPRSSGLTSSTSPARVGSVDDLASEFKLGTQTIRNWLKQADLDRGRRSDGLTSVEREELSRLRKENKQLRIEREILGKAAAWFARETDSIPPRSSNS